MASTINYTTQFYQSAKSGNLEKLKEAVLSGVELSHFIDLALVEAVSGNHKEVVEYLLHSTELSIHADINYEDSRPFNWAIINNNIEMAEYLFNEGAVATSDNHYAFRTLYVLENKCFSLYVKLFELWVNDLKTNSQTRDFFLNWSKNEHYDEDLFLLSSLAEDKPEKLRKLFLELVIENKAHLADILIGRGIDIHENNEEALISACRNGAKDSVILLVENGADIHCSGQEIEQYYKDGISIYTEINGKIVEDESQIVKNIYDYEKDAPFIIACRYTPEAVLYLLEKEEAQVTNQEIENYSFDRELALKTASYYGIYEILKYLEEKRFNLAKESNSILNWYVGGLMNYNYNVNSAILILELLVNLGESFSDPQISFNLIHQLALEEDKKAIELVIENGGDIKKFYKEYKNPQGCTCSDEYYLTKEMEKWCKSKI